MALSVLRPAATVAFFATRSINANTLHSFAQSFITPGRDGSLLASAIRRFSQYAGPNKALLRKFKHLSQKEIDEVVNEIRKKRYRDTMYYMVGFSIFMLGGCWAAIPLYRMFCEDSSYGGFGRYKRDEDKIDSMNAVKDRVVRIRFNADAGGTLHWNFKPLQDFIDVHPGETALAFFTATNPTDKPIIGVSTYNIVPYEAAAYFNKIQCFCFEEQLLNPGEQVDLPVFFYLDPDFAYDPFVGQFHDVILSYTFFESKSSVTLQRPSRFFANKHVENFSNSSNKPLGKPAVETATA